MRIYKLETVAFLSGALVMILELTGSRVLSPYFGNSIYIWTGMIGVILGFLSLGYYYGGIIADKGVNLISSISGKNNRLFAWQYSTLKETFSQVTAYKINLSRPENEIQNIILVAHNNPEDKINTTTLPANMKLLDTSNIYDKNKILTDDYAPVEHLAGGFMGSN